MFNKFSVYGCDTINKGHKPGHMVGLKSDKDIRKGWIRFNLEDITIS